MNFYNLHKIVNETPSPKLKLQWEYNSNTFSTWLMSELTGKMARELENWKDENIDDLPFQDLFDKEDTRLVIPLSDDPFAVSVLEKLDKVGEIDFDSKTISINGRPTRLGKYILNKNSPFSNEEKEWWNGQGNPIEQLQITQKSNDYAMIVSRHPIDIARMSDHDGWTSCHAPDREYFQCTLADARGAGAIAYAVHKSDLKNIDLQAPEIFKDVHRVDGVKPLSRIRLRKFIHKKDDYDLAIPEDRIYGKNLPGMEDSLRSWALKTQQNKLQGKRPEMKEFKLVGGSYQDTQAGSLFNKFFNDDKDYDYAGVEYDGDEDQGMLAQYEEEVEIIEREFRDKFESCSFWSEVDESDGHPYVSYSAFFRTRIPDSLLIYPDGFAVNGQQYDDKMLKLLKKDIEKIAKNYDMYDTNVEIDAGEVSIDFRDDDGDADPDSFRGFLEGTVTDVENKKNEINHEIYGAFIQHGFAIENKIRSIADNWDEHPHQFQNFIWEGEEPTVQVSLTQPIIMSNQQYDRAYPNWQDQFKNLVIKELKLWANKSVNSQKLQKTLYKEPEFQPPTPRNYELKITPEIELNPQSDGLMSMSMTINFEPFAEDEHVEEIINFIGFLDKNYERFTALMRTIYGKVENSNKWIPTKQTPSITQKTKLAQQPLATPETIQNPPSSAQVEK